MNIFRAFWKGEIDKSLGDDMNVNLNIIKLQAQKIQAIQRDDWKEVARLESEIEVWDKKVKTASKAIIKKGDADRQNREVIKEVLSGKSYSDRQLKVNDEVRRLQRSHLSENQIADILIEEDGYPSPVVEAAIAYVFGKSFIQKAKTGGYFGTITKEKVWHKTVGDVEVCVSEVQYGSSLSGKVAYNAYLFDGVMKKEMGFLDKNEAISYAKQLVDSISKSSKKTMPSGLKKGDTAKASDADAKKIKDQIDNLSKDFDRYNDAGDQKAADRVWNEIQKLEKKLEGLQLDKASVPNNQDALASNINAKWGKHGAKAVGDDGSVLVTVYDIRAKKEIIAAFSGKATGDGVQEGGVFVNGEEI